MTSPDDIQNLEQRLTRALQAHGESVEPSPDAYTRLVRAVEEAPTRSARIWGVFPPLPGGRLPVVAGSLRPLAFLAALLAVAALGGYSLFSLASSPAETATAAPATADVSGLVPGADESTADDDEAAIEADHPDDTASTSDARTADSSPHSTDPSDSTADGGAAATAGSPDERHSELTYAPVRATRLEAAQAFLDLLDVDEVQLEQRNDRVIVRSDGEPAPAATNGDETILTVLSIGAIGDGFMVLEARTDQLGLTIDNAVAGDPTADDIVDETAVAGAIEMSGSASEETAEISIELRSVVDGSVLVRTSSAVEPAAGGPGYRSSVPVTGAERVWVVATAPVDNGFSLAARPVLYTGRADPASYTVVGIPPDDPDGGLVVRSTPNGSRVGLLESGSTGVRRLPVPPRLVDDVVWWAVGDGDGLEGWAAARYLAIDETTAETTMVELARAVVAAVSELDPTAAEDIGLSRPMFVGSIVAPRPINGLTDVNELLTARRRLTGVRLTDFYGFDRWSEAEVFVPTGYRQDGAAEGARAYFGDLPSVVIRSMNPESGGWERVHLFVSRNGDQPMLLGMVLETEPLPDSAGVPDDAANPPSAGTDG